MRGKRGRSENLSKMNDDNAFAGQAGSESVFRHLVTGEWADYYPKDGEQCEYQIRPGVWIACEIIREQRREPTTRYLARYQTESGILKTGVVGSCNLRAAPQNAERQITTASDPRKQ
jgi:hypothetical protein